tara:strand:- start:691 stop:1506 length:816 start_codon:yes stop_codon:yes gene_type:complete
MASLRIASLFSVTGKTVWVTGGSRGIGRMIAEGFVANGANVIITARDSDRCAAASDEMNAMEGAPGTCSSLPGDLSSVDSCRALAAALAKHGNGRLDVLVNNSGTSWGEDFDAASEKGWDKVFDLNVKGMFFLTQACAPLLSASGTAASPARVINIGSVAGVTHQPWPTHAYDLSKAAVHHLTSKLGFELAPRHITVNAIAPGLVPSSMSEQLETYANAETLAASAPLGRVGAPCDLAGAAIYLASPAASWVTGTVLRVDGGLLAHPCSMT